MAGGEGWGCGGAVGWGSGVRDSHVVEGGCWGRGGSRVCVRTAGGAGEGGFRGQDGHNLVEDVVGDGPVLGEVLELLVWGLALYHIGD